MRSIPKPDEAYEGAGGRRDDFAPSPSYYGRPMLKAPHWEWNVIAYLFLGGITGGLGLISLLADPQREDERRLRRSVRYASLVLAAANPALLISHLGRPERFHHMLRIVKFKSPMSLGVWGLVLYSGVAGANVARELAEANVLPGWMAKLVPAPLTALQAATGAFIAGYTGVLLSATANPLWSSGKSHIPAASVASSAASACALAGLLAVFEGNHGVARRLERLEMVAGALEALILTDFEKRSGEYGKPMFTGKYGKRLRTYTLLGGILAPMALNFAGNAVKLPKPIDAVRNVAASVLTLMGGYVFREVLIDAAKASAGDPHVAFRQPR